MLFKTRFDRGITDGSINRTFRRWKRLQVVPGNRYPRRKSMKSRLPKAMPAPPDMRAGISYSPNS
jgi:hypothetical protein